jgi:hypothetical protein
MQPPHLPTPALKMSKAHSAASSTRDVQRSIERVSATDTQVTDCGQEQHYLDRQQHSNMTPIGLRQDAMSTANAPVHQY